MNPKVLILAMILPGLTLLAGCDWRVWQRLPAPAPTAARGADLRVGVGYSDNADPAVAARTALNAATAGFKDIGPDLVLVWDNWNDHQAAQRGLDELASWTSARTIYGGHVAWPVATTQSDNPAVAVVAFAGGWGVSTSSVQVVTGREDSAAAYLAKAISPSADEPARGGQLLMLFGELPGQRATALLAGLTRRIDRNTCIFGGGGGGQAGSGWQYVAGQMTTDTAWAARLSGPFRVAAARVTTVGGVAATHDSIAESTMLSLTVLMGDAGRPPADNWRLLLMTPSAGWLGMLDSPRLARQAVDKLGPGAIVAGWAGHSQIAPDADDRQPIVGQFDLAMALLTPVEPATTTTQPDGR